MAIILDGKLTASKRKSKLKKIIKDNNLNPNVNIIQYGKRPDSTQYVNNKINDCIEVGISHELTKVNLYDIEVKAWLDIKEKIKAANISDFDGVMLQLPLDGICNKAENELIEMIDPLKDVDGLTSRNKSLFYFGNTEDTSLSAPCTPLGIMNLLDDYGIKIKGKTVCVIGRSEIVGKPMASMMLSKDATVITAHSKTPKNKLKEIINIADIVISAVGVPGLINTTEHGDIDWSNKVIVDVGTNRVNGIWCGDIENDIKENSYAYTPVPGGVGPMTRVTLLEKVVYASLANNKGVRHE